MTVEEVQIKTAIGRHVATFEIRTMKNLAILAIFE